MFEIDRSSIEAYSKSVKGLTNEELYKEIWSLSEHLQYLNAYRKSVGLVEEFLYIAKQEYETRMFSQGYQ